MGPSAGKANREPQFQGFRPLTMPSLGLIILILIIALPLLEIALLIKVGAVIGIWATLGIILVTGLIGMTVFQQQGFGVARRAFDQMQSGEPPLEPMAESALLAFAGGCLIAPGLITDAIGLFLLVPPLRRILARSLIARARFVHVDIRRSSGRQDGGFETIDGSFERLDEREMPGKRPPVDPPRQ
jgi:UPF0716 protein FxsA